MEFDSQWYENEDLWHELKPFFFHSERWANTAEQVDRIINLLDLQQGARIVDLCCGPGRHSLELARRGYAVTGIDRTAEYLDEARAAAKSEGLEIDFRQADMREFRDKDMFDAAINMFTSFGYFEDIEDDRRVVENVYISLKHNGKFLMDTIGKEAVARDFKPSDWHRYEDGSIVLEERSVLDNWSKTASRWTIIRNGVQREFEFILRCYSAAEMQSLFSETGFSESTCYGGLSGVPYDHEAKRLVIVGKK